MGRGNVNLSRPLCGGFFLTNEHFNTYYDELNEELDEWTTQFFFDEFVHNFQERFISLHPDFTVPDKASTNILLTSEYFDIVIEDNEWSQAIRFLNKVDNDFYVSALYKTYLDSMQELLLDMFEYIHIYTGPWTSGVIRKEVK